MVDAQPHTAQEPTLRLQGIHKSYGTGTEHETEVLHGIDLSLDPGEFVALIGPSGSGKSTLLNIIGLLDKPSAGQLFLTGQEAESLADKALTRLRAEAVGFVFQFHNLLPAFTAVGNVMLPLLAARGRAAGVDITIDSWPGMIHVWHAFAHIIPEARDAFGKIGAFLKARLA